jgi:hypothetical protein
MTSITAPVPSSRFAHHPREVAAAVTLRGGAAALVAPPGGERPGSDTSITTACGALVTRMALIEFLADPSAPAAAALVPYDPFAERELRALHGIGPEPDRSRVRRAGERCVEAWRRWERDLDAGDDPVGVAGALALGAWCAWALGSRLRAQTRARYALDIVPDDPLASFVLRATEVGHGPSWS